jgi:hypothetical protein
MKIYVLDAFHPAGVDHAAEHAAGGRPLGQAA